MEKQSRHSGGANKGNTKKPTAKAKGAPRRFQGLDKAKSSGLKAGVFARMREGVDAVAFAVPGLPTKVRLYEEVLEAFEARKQVPRNFVVVVSANLDSDQFEAFQIAFSKFAPHLKTLRPSGGERSYWSFVLKNRTLLGPAGVKVDMRTVEKRAVQKEDRE